MLRMNVTYEYGSLARLIRYRVVLAALAATVLAVTWAGMARAAPASLNAGPAKVHGYQMLIATSQQKGSLSLQVILTRASRSSTHQHTYTLPLKPGALKIAANLSSATLKTGELGGFGSISMKLVHPGKLAKVTTCGVTGQARRGTLSGSLRLVLDKTFFRTVTMKTIPASVSRNNGSGSCQTGQQPHEARRWEPDAERHGQRPDRANVPRHERSDWPHDRDVDAERAGRTQVRISHLLITTVSGPMITVASDLSTAHVNGEAARPLFGGAADFNSRAPVMAAGKCTMSFGKLSGTLSAYFDSIGNQSIGGSASLTRC